jgi:hypothetical protein
MMTYIRDEIDNHPAHQHELPPDDKDKGLKKNRVGKCPIKFDAI